MNVQEEGMKELRKIFAKIVPNMKLPSAYYELNLHLPLKAIACCFKITVDEDEKEKQKNELIYEKKDWI